LVSSYKEREARSSEAYYIVETHDGAPCGTVRLYNFGASDFTWGSFVLNNRKPRKAALDVAVHSFGIGFTTFSCNRAQIDAKIDNISARNFYDRFGMTQYGEKDGIILRCDDMATF